MASGEKLKLQLTVCVEEVKPYSFAVRGGGDTLCLQFNVILGWVKRQTARILDTEIT